MKTPEGVKKTTGYTTDIITDITLNWLKKKRNPEKPFFLMSQHKAPHRNWQPGPKYLSKYDHEDIPEPKTLRDSYKNRLKPASTQAMTIEGHLSAQDLKLTPPHNLNMTQKAAWDAAYSPKNQLFKQANLQGDELLKWKYQRYVKDYLRCVDSVDENIGRLLDYLEESGLAENTVVIYSSDQGWYLGEHGWYDKRWMYEESFRTPLIVRWPGVTPPGSQNSQLVQNLDYAQTFLDICGVSSPQDMQGASMVPILKGMKPKEWRKSLYYHYYEYPGAHDVRRHYGVRTDRYKLIHFYNVGGWELYDLEKDPHELNSLYGEPGFEKITGDLKKELARLRRQYQVPEDTRPITQTKNTPKPKN
jgi:arylsulfatase A-like enzyme